MKLRKLSINLPFGIGGVEIEVTEFEKKAAWELYVQLVTRIATQRLEPGTGSAREAVTSLYNLYEITRAILIKYGPGLAADRHSVGFLAIRVLNEGLRPFLVYWHGNLGTFEDKQTLVHYEKFGGNSKAIIDESSWSERKGFYESLEEKRIGLLEYTRALEAICGID